MANANEFATELMENALCEANPRDTTDTVWRAETESMAR